MTPPDTAQPGADPPFAAPARAAIDEFRRGPDGFDGFSYLYAHEDVRDEIGVDPEGAWRHYATLGHLQDRAPAGLPRAAPRRVDPARLAARPFGINLFGPFEAVSGLGTAARNLACAVAATGIPFVLRPHDVEAGHARLTSEEARTPVRFRINLVLVNADQLRPLVRLYPDGAFDDAFTIAVWAWELAAFRTDHLASACLVDEVWTNSTFERAAIAAACPVPVHLVPLPVPPPENLPRDARARGRALFGLPPAAFVFLCPFDAGSTEDRKNPAAAIDAFLAAFADDPAVLLVVKCHSPDPGLAARLVRISAAHPSVRLIAVRLPPDEMALLQAASDALVSSHRAEGFGLNLAEFLVRGRPVVATDCSGNRDFLDGTTGFPVPCRPVPIAARTGPYLAGRLWAEPDPAALARTLREVVAHPAAAARRAARGAARMADAFSPEAIGRRIAARIEALDLARLGTPPAARARDTEGTATVLVPPDPARAEIAWPARPRLLSVVLQPGTPLPAMLAALEAQTWPFWEAFCLGDWPPPEDAAARIALRASGAPAQGGARVRLIDVADPADPDPNQRAVAATAGDWLLLPSADAELAPDFLLRVARWLDRDDPPDRRTIAAGPGSVALVQKRAWHADRTRPAPRPIPSDATLSLRRLDPAASPDPDVSAASPDPDVSAVPPDPDVSGEHEIDAAPLSIPIGTDPNDLSALAAAALRGETAELLLLAAGPAALPEGAPLDALLAPLGDRRIGAVLAPGSDDGAWLLATTRLALDRFALLPLAPAPAAAGPLAPLCAAYAELGLDVAGAPPPALPPDLPPDLSPPDLAAHIARVAASFLFDDRHYRDTQPDVAAAGIDPLSHYCEHGWREHRAPNFYFDPVFYRARHMPSDPDETVDPLLHWIAYRFSGVRPSPLFDPAWVRRHHHLPLGIDPLAWYLERRREENVAPLAEFDPAFYRARRRDVAYRKVDPFEHYMRFGATEGVNPSPDFDTGFYRRRYMRDVPRHDPVASNPLLHFLERRDAQPVVTSQLAALRQQLARLRLLGRDHIDLALCWHDGLPQGIDPLRSYLGAPTLALPFRIVFANEAMAASTTDPRLLAALRAPYDDPYDDPDIADRLAECFADPRALRTDGSPQLGLVRGRTHSDGAREFLERIATRLRTAHAITPVIVPLD